MTKTKVIGVNELVKDFDKLAKDLGRDAIMPILEKNGQTISEAMKGLVREKTGRLRNSIKVIKAEEKYGTNVIIGPDFKPDGRGTMTIPGLAAVNEYGADIREPRKAEYRKVLINGEWKTMGKGESAFQQIPPKPFIRPAFDMTREKVSRDIVKDLDELVDKKAKKNNLKTK